MVMVPRRPLKKWRHGVLLPLDTPDDDVELVASMPLDAGQRLRGVIPLNENILFSCSTVIKLIKYGLIYT